MQVCSPNFCLLDAHQRSTEERLLVRRFFSCTVCFGVVRGVRLSVGNSTRFSESFQICQIWVTSRFLSPCPLCVCPGEGGENLVETRSAVAGCTAAPEPCVNL